MHYPDGESEELDEVFDTESEADEEALYICVAVIMRVWRFFICLIREIILWMKMQTLIMKLLKSMTERLVN